MRNLGLPQEGPLISEVEVVKLTQERQVISRPCTQEKFIQPKVGTYHRLVAELVDYVNITGKITLIETDD